MLRGSHAKFVTTGKVAVAVAVGVTSSFVHAQPAHAALPGLSCGVVDLPDYQGPSVRDQVGACVANINGQISAGVANQETYPVNPGVSYSQIGLVDWRVELTYVPFGSTGFNAEILTGTRSTNAYMTPKGEPTRNGYTPNSVSTGTVISWRPGYYCSRVYSERGKFWADLWCVSTDNSWPTGRGWTSTWW